MSPQTLINMNIVINIRGCDIECIEMYYHFIYNLEKDYR